VRAVLASFGTHGSASVALLARCDAFHRASGVTEPQGPVAKGSVAVIVLEAHVAAIPPRPDRSERARRPTPQAGRGVRRPMWPGLQRAARSGAASETGPDRLACQAVPHAR